MVLRERLLKVQSKLARFQTELHPAAKRFLAETQNLGFGKAEEMVAKKFDIEPSHIKVYQDMIGKGLLKSLMRTRAYTMCNSRHFKRGVVYCPADN